MSNYKDGSPGGHSLIFTKGFQAVAKTLKIIDAGPIQKRALYDRVRPNDGPAQRAAKHRSSTEVQRRMNFKNSAEELELQLAINFRFPGAARVCVFTFDDPHMPKSRAEVERRFRYFRNKYNAACEADGLPRPVMFWSIEVLTSAGGRWHIHAIITAYGDDDARIRRCWPYGSDVEIDRLRVDRVKNYASLARYMTKEARECQDYTSRPGLRSWSHTQNAKKPEVETVTVPDDFELTPPPGSTVLLDERRSTEYAAWHVLKTLAGGAGKNNRPPSKRTRKRKT